MREIERVKKQAERIARQKQLEIERVNRARLRGEAKTGLDMLERIKLSRQLVWRLKWNKRMKRWDAKEEKFEE